MIAKYGKCGLQGYLNYFASPEYFANLTEHNALDPEVFFGTGIEKSSAFHLPLYAGSLMDKAIELWKDSITDGDLNISPEKMMDKENYSSFTEKAVMSVTKRFIKDETLYNPDELDFMIKQAVFALPIVYEALASYYQRLGVIKTITKVPFEFQMDENHNFSGEIDEILMTSDGRLVVNDYKLLANNPDQELLRDDFQGKAYIAALRLYNKWNDSALDVFLGDKSIKDFAISDFSKFVVQKPQIKQQKKETLTAYRNRYIGQIKEKISVHPVTFGSSKVASALGEINSFCKNKKYTQISKSRYPLLCKSQCDYKEMCVDMDALEVVMNLYHTQYKQKETRNRELVVMKKMKDLAEFFEYWKAVPENFESRLHFLMNIANNTKIAVSDDIRENYRTIYAQFKESYLAKPTKIDQLTAQRLLAGGVFEVKEGKLEFLMTIIQRQHNEYKKEIDDQIAKFPAGTATIVEVKHQEDDVFDSKQVPQSDYDALTKDVNTSIKEANDSKLSDDQEANLRKQIEALPVNIRKVTGERRGPKRKAEFDKWKPIAKSIGIDLHVFLEMKAAGQEKGLVNEAGQTTNKEPAPAPVPVIKEATPAPAEKSGWGDW